jgi:hypothetical protein
MLDTVSNKTEILLTGALLITAAHFSHFYPSISEMTKRKWRKVQAGQRGGPLDVAS